MTDWSVPRLWRHLAGERGSSARLTKPVARLSDDMQVLYVAGLYIGKIQTVTTIYDPSIPHMGEWYTRIHDWRCKIGMDFEPLFPNRETLNLLETLIKQSLDDINALPSSHISKEADPLITEKLADFKSAINNRLKHRRMATFDPFIGLS